MCDAGGDEAVVRLGFMLPMTGVGQVTQSIVGAATLAIADINANPSFMRGRRLEYIWADSGCNSIKGVKAAQELLAAEIHGIIGAACSSACEPAAFLTAARGLPQVPLFAESLALHDQCMTM